MTGAVIFLLLAAAAGAAFIYMRSQAGAPTQVEIKTKKAAPKPAGPKKNWLVGEGGPLDGKAFHIAKRQVTIGRAPSNFIQVTDPNVSRQQCQVKPHPDGIEVVDMTSTNAMMVNGQAVGQAVMKDGDMLQVGTAAFIYRAEGDFGKNAAWAPKEAGDSVRTSTTMMSGAQAAELAKAWKLYEEHGRDLDAAATAMGIDSGAFQTLIDQ